MRLGRKVGMADGLHVHTHPGSVRGGGWRGNDCEELPYGTARGTLWAWVN